MLAFGQDHGATQSHSHRLRLACHLWLARLVAIVVTIVICGGAIASTADASAGIRWQAEVGGRGITVTNPEWGWAGPKVGNNWHTNVHIYSRSGGYHELLNVHASTYNSGGSTCFYGYDTIHRWTIYDVCFPSWTPWAGAAAAAVAIAYQAVRAGVPYILVPAELLL
jgi:hypothetical protein